MVAVAGDQDLAAEVRDRLSRHHRIVAAGTVVAGHTRITSVGAPLNGTFEIGSISKALTGLLYVDAVERGEVRPGTTLGELLPLDGAAAARITLGALAIHRSGLPRMAPFPEAFGKARATWRFVKDGINPYPEDVATLIARVRRIDLGQPHPRYSNVGFELLGHAVAAAAGTSYRDLVQTRLAAPLGLRTLSVPGSAADLEPNAVAGRSWTGRPKDPWASEGIGPAGGIRASVEDMTTLAGALLTGTAPGVQAMDPVADFRRGMRVGAAWMTSTFRGRTVTWHNGGTGGFRSWLGLDRAAGSGAVVLSATAAGPVDGCGLGLLLPSEPRRRRAR